ncbi:hypothetical protein RHMOL_Rhmol01G0191900 [Rhododendron molle]|uniref:Uncharacterized protein n=1 Tax=Rhododendron molle TaxID=49168 RepID=A0ACC0Q662_RHOML|nr:hypothetical protein RHMOL_Rhmol01G0191900 [Rhododendron molle]
MLTYGDELFQELRHSKLIVPREVTKSIVILDFVGSYSKMSFFKVEADKNLPSDYHSTLTQERLSSAWWGSQWVAVENPQFPQPAEKI